MTREKKQIVKIKDYGDEAINRLARAQEAFEAMPSEERGWALRWFKSKYSAEWPSDNY